MTKRILTISLLIFGLLAALIAMLFGYQDIPLEQLKSKYAMDPSAFINVGNMDVHYRDEGILSDSIPIVLIHGTGSSLHTFDEWTTQLKSDYRVIRMDLPAYGLTGPFPDRNYSMESYANFIYEFLGALGVTKCIIGGNSLGGSVAWNFTAKYPEMVDKLLLIDAAGYPFNSKSVPAAFKLAKIPILKQLLTFITPRPVVESSVQNVYADDSKVTDELVERYFELTLREGNRQAFVDRMKFQMGSDESESIIQSINQPTLILWGDQDELIPIESAYRFQSDLPNNTLVILEGIGHVPMEESPLLSLEPVVAFLQKDSLEFN